MRKAYTLRSFMTIDQFTALSGARIEWAGADATANGRKAALAASDGLVAPVPIPEATPVSSGKVNPLPPFKPTAAAVEPTLPIEYRQDAWEQAARRVSLALTTQALRARQQALSAQKQPAQRPPTGVRAESTFAPPAALPGRQSLGVGTRLPPPAGKPAVPQRQQPVIRQDFRR